MARHCLARFFKFFLLYIEYSWSSCHFWWFVYEGKWGLDLDTFVMLYLLLHPKHIFFRHATFIFDMISFLPLSLLAKFLCFGNCDLVEEFWLTGFSSNLSLNFHNISNFSILTFNRCHQGFSRCRIEPYLYPQRSRK